MKPAKLHVGVRIRGDDGFIMAKYMYSQDKENFDKLMGLLKVENPKARIWDTAYLQKKFTNYLKGFCSDGFCIGTSNCMPKQEDDYKQWVEFYVGFRSKKDLFKFNIRFAAKRTRWWKSTTPFTVIGVKGDPYVPAKAGDKWNKEDPHGFIRP